MMTNSNVDEKMTTIQFLTLNGSRKKISLAASKTISQLWEEIETLYKGACRNRYYLVQLYPRIVYDDETLSSTLVSLGLVPTGNLGFEKRKQPKNSETINQEETQAKKEIGEREKQRALYEEQRREQLRMQKEDKVRRDNLLKEMQEDRELLALRSAPVMPKSEKVPDVQRLQNRIDGETHIKLVKLDGSKMLLSLSEKITISQLWDEIELKYTKLDRSKYRLAQVYPRKVYGEECMTTNLASLGLSPSATLTFEKEIPEVEMMRSNNAMKKTKVNKTVWTLGSFGAPLSKKPKTNSTKTQPSISNVKVDPQRYQLLDTDNSGHNGLPKDMKILAKGQGKTDYSKSSVNEWNKTYLSKLESGGATALKKDSI